MAMLGLTLLCCTVYSDVRAYIAVLNGLQRRWGLHCCVERSIAMLGITLLC